MLGCPARAGFRVSDISVWEIGNKAAKGKLTLIPGVSAWVGPGRAWRASPFSR